MGALDNRVIGINVLMKPKNTGLNWQGFVENLVLINKEKGNAFLYEFYELDGVIHLHERFKNAAAYKKHFDFFSAEVAEEFFGFMRTLIPITSLSIKVTGLPPLIIKTNWFLVRPICK